MRRSLTFVSFAVSLVFLANNALADKKPKAKAKKADGPSAAATWTDPTENEKSDKGPFAPHNAEVEAPVPEPKSTRAPDKGRMRDHVDVFGQIVIGFGSAPINQANYAPGPKGTAIGFLLGGRYDFSPAFSAGLRIPLTSASVPQIDISSPTGSLGTKKIGSTVFGAPELMGEYRVSLNRLTFVPIDFGVGIPVAGGNPDTTDRTDTVGQQKAYANKLADATTGWRDGELFQPKRLPIIVGAGIHHERHDWELHADAKFVLLPSLSSKVANPAANGAPDPIGSGNYKSNSFALREVTTLGGTYNFTDKPLFYAGLDFAMVWSPIQTFAFNGTPDDSKPTSIQAVLEPRVGARFGAVSPSVGYIAPLGGRLGDASDGGIRLRVSALF